MPRKFTYTTQVYDKSVDFPTIGDVNVIYIDASKNKAYRYDDSYFPISSTEVGIWGAIGNLSKNNSNGGGSSDVVGLQGAQIQFNNNGNQPTFGFNAQLVAANSGTGIPTSGRLDVYPVTPNKTLTNVSLTINVSTLGLGALARLVVYSDVNSFPNTKLYESTNIDCSTTGNKTVLTGLTFTAGNTYWLGFYSNGIASFRTITASSMLPLFASSLTTASIAWSRINTTLGTAPTTFNYNTFSAANQINIQIRQA